MDLDSQPIKTDEKLARSDLARSKEELDMEMKTLFTEMGKFFSDRPEKAKFGDPSLKTILDEIPTEGWEEWFVTEEINIVGLYVHDKELPDKTHVLNILTLYTDGDIRLEHLLPTSERDMLEDHAPVYLIRDLTVHDDTVTVETANKKTYKFLPKHKINDKTIPKKFISLLEDIFQRKTPKVE